MDKIVIKNLIVKGHLGANHWQLARHQMLIFNVVGYIDFPATDSINDTVSYSVIAQHIQSFTENETKIKTLEVLANKLALDCLLFGLKKVELTIEKSQALLHADTVGIKVIRTIDDLDFLKDMNSDLKAPDTEDVIFIKDLQLTCIIGVNACERIEKQRVILNLELKFRPQTLQLRHSIPEKNNYSTVAKKVTSFVENSSYKTLEMMSCDLANVILNQCGVDKVMVRIEKPSALMFAETSGVEITREKQEARPRTRLEIKEGIAYLAIGTNIGDRVKNIESGIAKLKSAGITVLDTSFLYETKPLYVTDQPLFLNAAIKVQTKLSPLELLDQLKQIEKEMGRDFSGQRNGPRIIDLDILFYDHIEFQDERLTIPHPRIQERFFVLEPLSDIAADYSHPTLFRTVSQLLKLLQHSEIEQDMISKVFPIRNHLWNFNERTFVMGILNVTPDSFSDGGEFFELEAALKNFQKMAPAADIIDIGGQSTRPNAPEVGVEEELKRVLPLIEAIRKIDPKIPISVDTYHAEVAKRAILAGADLINDVSGGTRDPEMLAVMQGLSTPVCLMHMRGDSNTMTSLTNYPGGLFANVGAELLEVVQRAIKAGLYRWNIIIDPGIGFAKDYKQNYELISKLPLLTNEESKLRGMPVLVGISRKSFIGKALDEPIPAKRVWGSAAATTAAILNGASIIRVHDVLEMKDVAVVSDVLKHH